MATWMRILLACSLAFNAALAGMYAWSLQRGVDRDAIAWAARELELTGAQQSELAEVQRAVRADVRAMLDGLRPAIGEAIARIRAASPGDRSYAPPLRAVSEAGLELQLATVDRLLAFRARLAPAQRARFDARVADHGFLRRLAGLGPPAGAPR